MNTVLLIDKDPRSLRAFSRTLKRYARQSDRKPQTVDFLSAMGPSDALSLLRRTPVDLIVMNIDSAGPKFVQFIADILVLRPQAGVCVMSKIASDPRFEACLDAGAMRVLDLPESQSNMLPIFGAIMASLQQALSSRREETVSSVRDAVHLRGLRGDSVVLLVEAMTISGRIFLHEGQIIHAEAGTLTGVIALRRLLGELDAYVTMVDYFPPPQSTITPGLWEYLHNSPVEKDNLPNIPRPDRPDVPVVRPRNPEGKLPTINIAASRPRTDESGPDHASSEKAWPHHLKNVVVRNGQEIMIDSVETEETEHIHDLMEFIQQQSKILAQRLGLPPSGQLEFLGVESTALVTFGSESQGFAINQDRLQPSSQIAQTLLDLAQTRRSDP